jgi:thymidylate synthase ThyX
VVITSTQWSNFLALRDHPDAQPEIRDLAQKIKAAMAVSTPQLLRPGEWHLPFVTRSDLGNYPLNDCIKASVARCARTSYFTHEGKDPNMTDDLALYERLVGSKPLHASPAEHQTTPDFRVTHWDNPELGGNLGPGWIQYRKTLPGECL